MGTPTGTAVRAMRMSPSAIGIVVESSLNTSCALPGWKVSGTFPLTVAACVQSGPLAVHSQPPRVVVKGVEVPSIAAARAVGAATRKPPWLPPVAILVLFLIF